MNRGSRGRYRLSAGATHRAVGLRSLQGGRKLNAGTTPPWHQPRRLQRCSRCRLTSLVNHVTMPYKRRTTASASGIAHGGEQSGDSPAARQAVDSRGSSICAAADITVAAPRSGSSPNTRIWLPRPEGTYRPTSRDGDPVATAGKHGFVLPAEPRTARVVFDRMRAAMRRGDPVKALESFDPAAQVGLTCTRLIVSCCCCAATAAVACCRAAPVCWSLPVLTIDTFGAALHR